MNKLYLITLLTALTFTGMLFYKAIDALEGTEELLAERGEILYDIDRY